MSERRPDDGFWWFAIYYAAGLLCTLSLGLIYGDEIQAIFDQLDPVRRALQ